MADTKRDLAPPELGETVYQWSKRTGGEREMEAAVRALAEANGCRVTRDRATTGTVYLRCHHDASGKSLQVRIADHGLGGLGAPYYAMRGTFGVRNSADRIPVPLHRVLEELGRYRDAVREARGE